MDKIAKDIIPLLKNAGIPYRSHDSRLRVSLPNNFGELEIGDLNNDDSIVGLIGESWHTHGETLKYEEGGQTDAESIFLFIRKIFDGKYFMVEEIMDDKPIRRIIENNMDRFYNYLPGGIEVKIYNAIKSLAADWAGTLLH